MTQARHTVQHKQLTQMLQHTAGTSAHMQRHMQHHSRLNHAPAHQVMLALLAGAAAACKHQPDTATTCRRKTGSG